MWLKWGVNLKKKINTINNPYFLLEFYKMFFELTLCHKHVFIL